MKRILLPWFPIVALIVSLNLLSCGGGGGVPTINPSFGGGIVTTPIGTVDDEARALAIQSDGKVVAAGYSTINVDEPIFALVRYNTNGTLDTTFNTTGKVTTPIGTIDDKVFALAIQSDGKLVVAGYSYDGTQNIFALVRYNTDGTQDTTFGTGGIVTTAIGTVDDEAFALIVQPLDGKLVAAGRSKINTVNGNVYEFALVRYNTDGTLDTTTFNVTGSTPGIVTTVIGNGGDDEANALVIQPLDGKLVAAGYSYNGTQNTFALVRYNTNGTLDTTGFGRQGIVTTAIVPFTSPTGINSVAFALVIRNDGRLVAAGYSTTNTSNQHIFANVFAVARFLPTGSLDTSFGGTGIATTEIGIILDDDEAFALAVRSDMSVVAAGRSYNSTTGSYEFALASYLP